jgi:hypothetical protein
MSKFNRPTTRPAVGASPIVTETRPTGTTYEGAPGYARDAKSELFLLAVANMVGEGTFYETGQDRDDRYATLVRTVAVADPAWTLAFLRWLRGEGNMRSASLVGAAEAVKARLDAASNGSEVTNGARNRQLVAAVLQRADEPGELLAYWTSRYGRAVPKPVKRGIGDGVRRLYSERALLKYDTPSHGFRFADVLELTHPSPAAPWQGALFSHALDRRHNRPWAVDPDALPRVAFNATLRETAAESPTALLDADRLRDAGMTWEDALSLVGSRVDKKDLWEALIPGMGYMALLRNLRNFDQADVSDQVAAKVAERLADPEQVARSRQFPFRFWAAHKHTASLRWAAALERAVGHSLANVPALAGRTLILVDRSPSMFPGYHFSTANKSDIPLAEQAALFGCALALRAADATLVEFGGKSRQVCVPRGGSVLRLMGEFGQIDGTDIPTAVRQHFGRHDRVVVVTDEQTRRGWFPSNMAPYGGARETEIDSVVPVSVPVYMWNLAGYRHGATPSGSGNRHTFGGLTDHAFRLIPLMEGHRAGVWPWEFMS